MKSSFGPIIDASSRVQILGTSPGEASLKAGQYYAHPRNQFWDIIYRVFGESKEDDYLDRIRFLIGNGLALWDVCGRFDRSGSLDSNITYESPNDVEKLLEGHPNIELVLLTSAKAEQLYLKYFRHLPIRRLRVPSPSPTPGRNIKSLPPSSTKPEQVQTFIDISFFHRRAHTIVHSKSSTVVGSFHLPQFRQS